jgi:hypothetical protein
LWLEEMNENYIAANFRVGEAGSQFIDNTYEPPRRMLTLIGLKDCEFNQSQPMRFLYSGDLVTDSKYGAGYVDQFGFVIDKSVWIVPRNDFTVTNADYMHPAHFLHQEEDKAHFVIVKGHRMVWIEQVRGWKKNDPLFMCYDEFYVKNSLKEKFIEADITSVLGSHHNIDDGFVDNDDVDSDYDGEPSQKRMRSSATGAKIV